MQSNSRGSLEIARCKGSGLFCSCQYYILLFFFYDIKIWCKCFRISEKNVIFVANVQCEMVIINIIYNYLESNRRITVPGLGTFLTRGNRNSMLFSEFLKGDDGVLRSLVVEHGMSEMEAIDTIERFVADVRDILQSGEGFVMPSMGRLYICDGAIVFAHEHAVDEPETVKMSEPEMVESEFSLEEEARIVDSIFSSFERDEVAEADVESVKISAAVPKYDVWLLSALAAGVFALFALLYGVIVEWQIGNISFGGVIDNMLYSIFG